MPLLSLRNLSKSFGSAIAVHALDLDIEAGDFCAILGPSGCGKSTLLRMIAGFAEPTTGSVVVDGADITAWGPERRPTNMVFQGYGLFPHLTVAQNVAFGLKLRREPDDSIAARVVEALRLVRLEGFETRAIDRLSGGQQQRVALARALVMRPKVLLLDEPLAALDLKLRHAMQEELARIHREIGGTFIFVTHDQGEAFALANRIVVMNEGRVEQAGTADAIYHDPRTLFVAGFVGEATLLKGARQSGRIALEAGPRLDGAGEAGAIRLMVRPNRIVADPPKGHLAVEARIVDAVFLGDSLKVTAETSSGDVIILRDQGRGARERYRIGSLRSFGWAPGDHRIIDERNDVRQP